MSDTPFNFIPAQAKTPAEKVIERGPKKTRKPRTVVQVADEVTRVAEGQVETVKRRRRRKLVPDDTAVLKICLKKLRALDEPGAAKRIVETLRIVFE